MSRAKTQEEKDAIAAKKKAAADAKAAKEAERGTTEQATEKIVWLKNRAYIDDKQRVESGVYIVVGALPDRLSKLKSDGLEVFEGEVPSRKLAEIARWAGLNPDGMDDEEIFEKVVSSEFKPF